MNRLTACGERPVRIVAAQHRAGRRGCWSPVADDHRRGAGVAQLREVLRVGDEGEIAGLRLLDAGDADDLESSAAPSRRQCSRSAMSRSFNEEPRTLPLIRIVHWPGDCRHRRRGTQSCFGARTVCTVAASRRGAPACPPAPRRRRSATRSPSPTPPAAARASAGPPRRTSRSSRRRSCPCRQSRPCPP